MTDPGLSGRQFIAEGKGGHQRIVPISGRFLPHWRPIWARALLTRALGAGGQPVEADLALRTALAGDRYLLCSEGLSAVVDRQALHTTLNAAADPEQTAQRLIELAHAAGAPDNIACVIADIIPA